MKRNIIIHLAKILTKVILVLMVLGFFISIVMVIHWHFDKQFYQKVYLANGFQAGLDSFNVLISNRKLTNISLSDLSQTMMYWILLRNAVIISLLIIILKHILGLLQSMESLQIFYDQNIRIFKKIANLGFLLTVIAFFNFEAFDGKITWYFTIPFQPLLFSTACLVLAEVFREGRKLLEDSNSIV